MSTAPDAGAGSAALAAVLEHALREAADASRQLCVLEEQATTRANDMAARAEMASRATSEFLANVSHELRTPLTAILGCTDLLRDDLVRGQGTARLLEAVDTIRRASEQLLVTLHDVLDLSRIEARSRMVEEVETDLAALLLEVDGLMQARVAPKGGSLRTRLESPVPSRIRTDPTHLRQILMHLVGNAARFTRTGAIDVQVRALAAEADFASEVLRIAVTDTGPGMTPEEAAALFQPWMQANASVPRRHGGTGRGLAICRQLAERMGGRVYLAHTAPGVGTTVVVELPLDAVPHAPVIAALPVEEPSLTHTAGRRVLADRGAAIRLDGRILLAKVGPENQRLIGHYLRAAGADVTVVEHGARALEAVLDAAAAGRPFDLLVTDVQMPVMDGYTLARTLRSHGHALPIIALTVHSLADGRPECVAAGCTDCVRKPIDRIALLEACARHLDHSAIAVEEGFVGGPPDIDTTVVDATVANAPVAHATVDATEATSAEDLIFPRKKGTPATAAPRHATPSRAHAASGAYGVVGSALVSELADDPDLGELVYAFVCSAPARERAIHDAWVRGDHPLLARLAHQLKGTGASYGYPQLTEVARTVEEAANARALAVPTSDDATLAERVEMLRRTLLAIACARRVTPTLNTPVLMGRGTR